MTWTHQALGQDPGEHTLFLKNYFIYFNWRLITLQSCSGFCHTLVNILLPYPHKVVILSSALWGNRGKEKVMIYKRDSVLCIWDGCELGAGAKSRL